MTPRISELKTYIFDKNHHAFRQQPVADKEALAREFMRAGVSPMRRAVRRFVWMMQNERPVLLKNQRIAFLRTVPVMPELFTAEEWADIRKTHFAHELGRVFNVNGNFALLLKQGFGGRRQAALLRLKQPCTQEQKEFLEAGIACIDAILDLSDRYALAAEKAGDAVLADILRRAVREGAKSFREALQIVRIMNYALWCAGHYHNTIGRFDQYMLPYYQADMERGMTREEALEWVEEFFITLNSDADLYPGMQQGDNGQSLVLGGVDRDGNDAVNELTRIGLVASLELKLIDPKINLRVSAKTPVELYELGSRLTKEGLGFPQYTNDDVAIPGLVNWGYSLEDARDYVMAACWELIIPGKANDLNNIDAISMPSVVREAALSHLEKSADFGDFLQAVAMELKSRCHALPHKHRNLFFEPAPVQSIFMDGCLEEARDIARGAKYNNFGVHGTGLATAADGLAAIRSVVFTAKQASAAAVVRALQEDFRGSEAVRQLLLEAPKVGNDDDAADDMLCFLVDAFADGLAGLNNERGGIYRPGTGSAMYYVTHGEELGATPDGRHAGAWLSANYSPALDIRLKGPISVIQSFSKPDLGRVVNGGPLTIEMHDTVFHNEEGIEKVARLVQLFILRGGHQIQLNTINRDRLLEAQAHPEQHRNLIVRVWGWSGYFVELDRVYQDHSIKRVEFAG